MNFGCKNGGGGGGGGMLGLKFGGGIFKGGVKVGGWRVLIIGGFGWWGGICKKNENIFSCF